MDNTWDHIDDGTQHGFTGPSFQQCSQYVGSQMHELQQQQPFFEVEGNTQNQISQATNNQNSQLRTGKKGKKKRQSPTKEQSEPKGAARTANYKQAEDEVICSAYLNVSRDAVVGVNQPYKTYWERITEYYNMNRGIYGERSHNSLQHRWGEISKSTSKFCGFYAEVERKNQSGKCEDDKIKDALQLYQGVMEESFKFIHCWLILKREQKWNEFLAEKMVPKTKQAPSAAQVDPNQTPSSVPQFTEENFVRPMGRDSSKKLRAANSAASSTGCLEVLQKIHSDRAKYDARQEELVMDESREIAERYERKLKIQEETMKIHSESVSIQKELLSKQVAIQQQMLELQEKERTDRVMMADLEKFSPWVREFYIQEQKEIAAKRRMQGGQSCSAHSAEK